MRGVYPSKDTELREAYEKIQLCEIRTHLAPADATAMIVILSALPTIYD
jgi:hypothetical protein